MKYPIHCSFLKLHLGRLKGKRLFPSLGCLPFPGSPWTVGKVQL